MSTRYKIRGSLFEDYTTVLFDLDRTIWDCFDARGTSIPAFKMEPPFDLLEEDVVSDRRKNVCRLQPNVRDVLASLDAWGMNLGIVSRSAVPDLASEAQPARMLLGKLALLKYFTYITVIKEEIDKGDYAKPEGRTLFIDDDPEQLQAVNARGLVDVLSRTKFADWAALFTESTKEKPRPATVQQFTNAPLPTTSALTFESVVKTAAPETYTNGSDIDGGIGGSARNMADMWHMEDHLEIDNGRDHLWGEPWEPMDSYFLNEPQITPTVDDKLKQQHPDRGGMAVSSLVFAAAKKRAPFRPTVDNMEYLISDLAYQYVKAYSQRKDLEDSQIMAIVKPVIVNTLATQYRIPQQTIATFESIIEDEIDFAIQTWIKPPAAHYEDEDYNETDPLNETGWDVGSTPSSSSTTSPYGGWRDPWGESKERKPYEYKPYKPPDPEVLSTAVRDFLLSRFAHERFVIKQVVQIVDLYVPEARAYAPATVERVVKALTTKYPTQFSMQGAALYIGDATQVPAGQAAVPRIDTERLKAVTQSTIEDFTQYGQPAQTPDGMYVFKDNGSDILAVAHLDTRQDLTHFDVQTKDETTVIKNAQLDDRLGAYIILDMLPQMGVTTDVLLTEGEEVGRSTAKHFVPTKQYKWIFSFDRRGMDTVLYQYHDPQTEKMMTDNQFTVGRGAFSDISYLEHLGAKGFNFGTGYYDNHGVGSHAIESHVMHNVQLFKRFYDKYKNTALPHAKGVAGKPQGLPPSSFGSVKRVDWRTYADGRSFAEQQLYAQAVEIAQKLRAATAGTVVDALRTYYDVSDTIVSRSMDIVQQAVADAGAGLPKAEQYPDYMGTMDVSPKDPKKVDALESPSTVRKDTGEHPYYELGLHGGPARPETDRPLTPYASAVDPAVDTDIHRPNTLLVHEGVLEALTFEEQQKSRTIVQHEAREDYQYVAPQR